ncbi:MAG: hypothetical protein Q9181_006563 [Wetmoreana brouardii]
MPGSDYPYSQYPKPVLLGVGVTFTILPIFVVGLRFYARRTSRTIIGLDDWCIVFALLLCTAGGVAVILGMAGVAAAIGGMGQHQRLGPHGELIHTSELTNYEKVPGRNRPSHAKDMLTRYHQCRYVDEIVTTLNLGVIKLSILLFYRRLFIVKSFKIASAIMMAIVASWAVSFTAAMIAQCTRPSYFWKLFEEGYPTHCFHIFKMYQGLAYSDLILDVLVLSLPIPMVASLHMPWKTKIRVIDVLMLGSVVIGSGIARLVTFLQVINLGSREPEEFLTDIVYYSAGPLFWMFAENAIAIIGACLPTLAPLWSGKHHLASRHWSRLKRSWQRSRSDNYDNLEGQHHHTSNEGDTSVQHLVTQGPAISIFADDISLDDRPPGGIQVQTTLSSSWTKQ